MGKVDFPRFETQNLGVLVRHDLQCQAVQTGKLLSVLAKSPVVEIAREDETLTRPVVGEHKRSKSGNFLPLRGYVPRCRQGSCLQGFRQTMLRKNRELSQDAKPRAKGFRECDGYR